MSSACIFDDNEGFERVVRFTSEGGEVVVEGRDGPNHVEIYVPNLGKPVVESHFRTGDVIEYDWLAVKMVKSNALELTAKPNVSGKRRRLDVSISICNLRRDIIVIQH